MDVRVNSFGSWRGMLAVSFVVAGILAGSVRASASPYTDHFDALIAELQSRSAALAGSTDKTELKQKKAVDKVLASFSKPSVSLVTDIKLAGKAAKTLAKAYPNDFLSAPAAASVSPAGGVTASLGELLQQAYDAFGADIGGLLDAGQTLLDSAPPGKCRDKAQAALDGVLAQLEVAETAPDLATLGKALGVAAKNILKGQSLVDAALECAPSSGGNAWYDWYMSYVVDGMAVSAYEDAQMGGPDLIYVTYYVTGDLSVSLIKEAGDPSLYFEANVGNPASGSNAILSGGYYFDGTNYYTITAGTVTITEWPSSFPERGTATFSFTATGTAGTINVTDGTLSVWIDEPF